MSDSHAQCKCCTTSVQYPLTHHCEGEEKHGPAHEDGREQPIGLPAPLGVAARAGLGAEHGGEDGRGEPGGGEEEAADELGDGGSRPACEQQQALREEGGGGSRGRGGGSYILHGCVLSLTPCQWLGDAQHAHGRVLQPPCPRLTWDTDSMSAEPMVTMHSVLMVLQREAPIESCLPKGQEPSPEGSSFVPTSSNEHAMRNCE